MSFLPNQAAAAVVLREAILACYRSGQMSAAQWERHCEDDPELRTMVEAKTSTVNRAYCIPGHLPLDGEIDRRLTKRLRTMVEAKGGDANDGGPSERSDGQNRPDDTSPGVKTGATDPIAGAGAPRSI